MLLLAGTFLFVVSVKRFEDIRFNLGSAILAFVFVGQASAMLGRIQIKPEFQRANKDSTLHSTATVIPDLKWDQGGTLQNVTLDQWRMGTYSDRLASAADLLKELRQKQLFIASIRSQEDYRIWAVALVACFESKTDYQESVTILSQKCTKENGLKDYLH